MKLKSVFVNTILVGVISPLLFITTIFSEAGFAQEDVIRIDSDLITVPATVLDRDGRYVTNLKKENFQIFEDGIEQEIKFFEPTEQPVTILFLLDVSSSMRSHTENLDVSVNALASQMRPNDRITAASFFLWTKLLVKPTKVSELQKGIKIKVRSDADCPSTYLYNAVDDALKQMKKIRGRKAIVLFTDGDGDGFGVTAKDNFRLAEEQDALIYTIKFGKYSMEPPKYVSEKYYFKLIEERTAYMRDLAQITGGRPFQVEDISNLETTFKMVAEELGRQYSLGYYPRQSGKKGERRQIKVKVNVPNAAVRARDNYIVGVNKN